MIDAAHYLRIPQAYGQWLGGLHWSPSGGVVQYAEGETFAFSREVALFFEGFAAGRHPVPFPYVLHLMHLLGHGRAAVPEEAWVLRRAYRAHRRGSRDTTRPLRNAGALCAELCRQVPAVPYALDADEVGRCLSSSYLMSQLRVRWLFGPLPATEEVPPLTPNDFEGRVLRALTALAPDDLEHWLRYGRGPVTGAPEQLAQELLENKPRTLAGVLAELAQRPRLAGAVPYVAQLVSALALPPRRLAHRELPTGGYADVATRGQPEQILPGQFALDPVEFVRRYAENELLYFRREEPHAQVREELVAVLDQGVRTWGDVRLVLSAAVLALGKLADRKGLPFRVAATSSADFVDPIQADDKALGEMLEASDLSPDPGLALERVLEEPAELARDVVLLTHPRSLREPDVAAAARRVREGTRLFALAVDEHGDVLLAEMKHGTPVKVCQFHVDFRPPEEQPKPAERKAAGRWKGDVEPVGFPFRFGVARRRGGFFFAFDQSGEWVLTASPGGLLHAARTDGSHWEMLPRSTLQGVPLTDVQAVLGVAGGFGVAGSIGPDLVVMHYDLTNRTCTAHRLGEARNEVWKWYYFPELHSVVADIPDSCRGVDLATGGRHPPRGLPQDMVSRAIQACGEAQSLPLPPPRLAIASPNVPLAFQGPSISLDPTTGRIEVGGRRITPAWQPFTPLADGRPALKDYRVTVAQLQGNVLAALFAPIGRSGSKTLRLFRGPDGGPRGEYPPPPSGGPFVLSSDGRWLAREINPCSIEVLDTQRQCSVLQMPPRGKFHPQLVVELGESWLAVQIDKWIHLVRWDRLIRWDRALIQSRHGQTDRRALLQSELAGTSLRPTGTVATRHGLPPFVRYDLRRFVAGARDRVSVAVDAYGQIAVFDRDGELVCMFFFFRGQAAAWMPDDTCHGPPSLINRPPTPGALEKIGRALHDAWERGE